MKGRDRAEAPPTTLPVCLLVHREEKNKSKEERGPAPLVKVSEATEQLLKVAGPSYPFLSSGPELPPTALLSLTGSFFFTVKAKRKKKKRRVKRFKAQLKSSETRTIYELQEMDLESPIHHKYPIRTGRDPGLLSPHQSTCQNPDEIWKE